MRETEDRLRLAKVKKEREREIAKTMKERGMDINIISEITGLPTEEIEEI